MSSSKDHVDDPVLTPLILFRGAIGFMSGMCLFLFGPIVSEAFRVADQVAPAEGYDPLVWTGFTFSLGLMLESLFEVPTGVFADRLGRKRALILSLVLRFLNLSVMFVLIVLQQSSLAVGPTWVIAMCVLYWVFFSLFFSLQNGAFEAWVNSALKESKRDEAQAWVLAHGENWSNVMFLVGSVLSIFFWTYDISFVAYLIGMGVAAACAGLCAAYMPENRRIDITGDGRVSELRKWGLTVQRAWRHATAPNLVLVFAMVAAVTSLTYLVNLMLFIFVEKLIFILTVTEILP